MTDPAFREKVLGLAAQGRITPEEGAQLLRAEAGQGPSWICRLWDPFEGFGPRVLLVLAAAGLLGTLLALGLGARFDGALDLHLAAPHPGWRVLLGDAVGIPAVTVLTLGGIARLLAPGTRIRDLVPVVLVGKLPLVLAAALLLLIFRQGLGDPLLHPGRLLLAALGILPCLAWSVTLLCLGLRNATGAKGLRLAGICVAGLLGAELLTKLLLMALS